MNFTDYQGLQDYVSYQLRQENVQIMLIFAAGLLCFFVLKSLEPTPRRQYRKRVDSDYIYESELSEEDEELENVDENELRDLSDDLLKDRDAPRPSLNYHEIVSSRLENLSRSQLQQFRSDLDCYNCMPFTHNDVDFYLSETESEEQVADELVSEEQVADELVSEEQVADELVSEEQVADELVSEEQVA